MTTKYRELIHFARQENDFSDEDIEEFHSLCGDFMGKWVTLTGTRNVTNYVHMIGAGHVIFYLIIFLNLFKYSNQGWEAMNQKLKRVYINNTHHRGNVGGAKLLKKGHVDPLWKYLARTMMWKTGEADEFFNLQ